MTLPFNRQDFQAALADWYASAQRPLPWRTEPSLYRTVVSELMLQQTQVKTMLPYYHRWLERFPDFESLAHSHPDDVLKHWEGLGYYSRARNFHKLAQAYIALDDRPQTPEEWQALPGIGPYTSAAISSIAQNYPAAVVDGNVVRILARISLETRSFKSNGEAVKSMTPLAEKVLDTKHPGSHNQAMMELGATLCSKHKPLCTLCPVLAFCQGAAHGAPEALPRIARKATETVEVERLWILSGHRLLLHRIPAEASQLAGQYELPRIEQLPLDIKKHAKITTKTRSITHRRIHEHIYSIPNAQVSDALAQSPELHWINTTDLEQITLSGPHRRWVNELLQQ